MVECKKCKTMLERFPCSIIALGVFWLDISLLCKYCAFKAVLFRLIRAILIVVVTCIITSHMFGYSILKGYIIGSCILGIKMPFQHYAITYFMESVENIMRENKGIIYRIVLIFFSFVGHFLFVGAKFVILTIVFGIYEIPNLLYRLILILQVKELRVIK